jgi:hypothetical protein
MKIIYQIYKKFLSHLLKKDKNLDNTKSINSEIENVNLSKYYTGISLRLTQDNNIDIFCELPNDLESLDKDQLIYVAEKYAEILLLINNGCFKEQIFEILTNHAKSKDSIKLALFVDNILSFYELLNAEFLKIKNQKNNKPLIRPISVFKQR